MRNQHVISSGLLVKGMYGGFIGIYNILHMLLICVISMLLVLVC